MFEPSLSGNWGRCQRSAVIINAETTVTDYIVLANKGQGFNLQGGGGEAGISEKSNFRWTLCEIHNLLQELFYINM